MEKVQLREQNKTQAHQKGKYRYYPTTAQVITIISGNKPAAAFQIRVNDSGHAAR